MRFTHSQVEAASYRAVSRVRRGRAVMFAAGCFIGFFVGVGFARIVEFFVRGY